jgi:hypothetical protein
LKNWPTLNIITIRAFLLFLENDFLPKKRIKEISPAVGYTPGMLF